jgi:hypothetical protein
MGEPEQQSDSPREVCEVKVLVALLVVIVLATSVAYAANKTPGLVTMQGQVVCLSCSTLTATANQPAVCMAGLAAIDGSVYTLVPNKMGKELESIATRSPKVEIEGYVLPGSRIVEIYSYRPIAKFSPVTSQVFDPWFNF